MKQQTTLQFDSGIASKLEAILQRCNDKVKLGSSLFDERGERAANAIAAADAGQKTTKVLPSQSGRWAVRKSHKLHAGEL